MHDELKTNDSAANAPKEIRELVNQLGNAQKCPVILTQERNGYHAYIPCPDCLHTHEDRELNDPKYSINLSALAELGEKHERPRMYVPAHIIAHNKKKEMSSICMRTRSSKKPHRFTWDYLINMSTVEERHPGIRTRFSVSSGVAAGDREDHWELDEASGEMAPPPPGKTICLSELPPGHPALTYLIDRGYSIPALVDQFQCSFCYEEYPYGENGIYYRKMPGGWQDTPQHRIIFKAILDGVPLTWQARVIDKVSEDGTTKLMLHPYHGGQFKTMNLDKARRSVAEAAPYDSEITTHGYPGNYWIYVWSKTAIRSNANKESVWMPLPPFDEMRDGALRFDPSKYRTAKYSQRQMLGWDAAVRAAKKAEGITRWCIISEGPLDAARVGPGGLAVLGSSMNLDNATLIANEFTLALLAFDDDVAGRQATEKISSILGKVKERNMTLQSVMLLPVPAGKDLGDMTQQEFDTLLSRSLRAYERSQ